MHDFLNITKALSDPNRVRALMFLRGKELCLCQIIELLGLSSSTVSKHMSILSQAGLVESRKESRWTYFSLPGVKAPPFVRGIIRWIKATLGNDLTVIEDLEKVSSLLKVPKEALCNNYKTEKRRAVVGGGYTEQKE